MRGNTNHYASKDAAQPHPCSLRQPGPSTHTAVRTAFHAHTQAIHSHTQQSMKQQKGTSIRSSNTCSNTNTWVRVMNQLTLGRGRTVGLARRNETTDAECRHGRQTASKPEQNDKRKRAPGMVMCYEDVWHLCGAVVCFDNGKGRRGGLLPCAACGGERPSWLCTLRKQSGVWRGDPAWPLACSGEHRCVMYKA